MDYKDYYKTLGVPRDADEKTIKKKFRELARKYHPDHNPGDAQAEAKFKEINEAYEVLGDAEKRKKYDQFGSEWEQYQRMGGNAGGFDWSRWTQGDPNVRYTYTGNGENIDFEEMFGGSEFSSFFETLFGGSGGSARYGGGARTRTRRQPAQDITQKVQITLAEAYHGTSRYLSRGGDDRREFRIPAGVDTGSKIRLKGEGGGGGHLFIEIDVLPDARFQRDGDDLTTEFDLPMLTALLGGKASIHTLDGDVSLTIPPRTQNGAKFRLKGKGMPRIKGDGHGDLFAVAKVILPTDYTDDEKALLEQFHELREHRPEEDVS